MPKIIVSVWIYVSAVIAAATAGGLISQVLASFPPSQLGAYGPVVPSVSRTWATLLPGTPAVLWLASAVSVALGSYLWRSRLPIETRLYVAGVVSALILFLAMFFTSALLVAYFYLPRVANGA